MPAWSLPAATLVGIMGLFNGGGRIFWAALSDRIGRRPVYAIGGLGLAAWSFVMFGLLGSGSSGNATLVEARSGTPLNGPLMTVSNTRLAIDSSSRRCGSRRTRFEALRRRSRSASA